MKIQSGIKYLCLLVFAISCGAKKVDFHDNPTIPALDYSNRVGRNIRSTNIDNPHARASYFYSANKNGAIAQGVNTGYPRARLNYVKDWPNQDEETFAFRDEQGNLIKKNNAADNTEQDNKNIVTNMNEKANLESEFDRNQGEIQNLDQPQDTESYYYQGTSGMRGDYNGPLSLGDPGLSASLWKESRRGNNLLNDDRAWQIMDLITITVVENSQGVKQADTEVKQSSSILSGISKLLGFQNDIVRKNQSAIPEEDLASLISADSKNNYKGEGDTTRRSSLTASISAMVVEVLPSGVLRIEGEKIISVNQEEQIMVVSGLVRPKDIDSTNNVQSSKIAQMRIDYYGKGIIGDVQKEGWLSSVLRKVWPF